MRIVRSTFFKQEESFIYRFLNCFAEAVQPAAKTILWLLKIMIPVSFAVMLLNYFGILFYISQLTSPFMQYLGLRGESALVLLSGALLNIYSAVAVIESIDLTVREITILAIMSLIAHNLIVETIVQKKTGSTGWWIVTLRIVAAFVAGLILNYLMPNHSEIKHAVVDAKVSIGFISIFAAWLMSTFRLILKVIVFIYLLNSLQKILDTFAITQWLTRYTSPILRLFGLPEKTAFLWIIANVIGLAWGSSILIEKTNAGEISRSEANLLNQHIAISHSLLEDTLLFAAIGVTVGWIIIPRLVLAFAAVWLYRIFQSK